MSHAALKHFCRFALLPVRGFACFPNLSVCMKKQPCVFRTHALGAWRRIPKSRFLIIYDAGADNNCICPSRGSSFRVSEKAERFTLKQLFRFAIVTAAGRNWRAFVLFLRLDVGACLCRAVSMCAWASWCAKWISNGAECWGLVWQKKTHGFRQTDVSLQITITVWNMAVRIKLSPVITLPLQLEPGEYVLHSADQTQLIGFTQR